MSSSAARKPYDQLTEEERAKERRKILREQKRRDKFETQWVNCCLYAYHRSRSDSAWWTHCHSCKQPIQWPPWPERKPRAGPWRGHVVLHRFDRPAHAPPEVVGSLTEDAHAGLLATLSALDL